MIRLVEIHAANWQTFAALRLPEDQQRFLDRPVGILARGYVYRAANARVFGVADGDTAVGLALVKDLDEEPACYDLQQFMIDERFQGSGFGTEALRQILTLLEREGRYDCAEVCVDRENRSALRLFEKAGFRDTGYIDESCPHCLNLTYRFR
jgi:RimJ/RimL family protein N-acetyltransferase